MPSTKPKRILRVNEIFPSIQGEGKFAGTPMLFIRLAGCNLMCPWCDTKYHTEGKEYDEYEVVQEILKHGLPVCWTGGEPALQMEAISRVWSLTWAQVGHHIETNGTIDFEPAPFVHIVISPKEGAPFRFRFKDAPNVEIKVVTDLRTVGGLLLQMADCLMPLTTGDPVKDLETKQRVWNYCIEVKKRYCERIHIDVWGNKRGV